MVNASARARLSLLAGLIGWLIAACATLPFQFAELLPNAYRGRALHDVIEGCTLWFGFTCLVSSAVWLVMVLAIAILVPPRIIVRYRVALAVGAALLGASVVGIALDLPRSFTHPGPKNPFSSFIMQVYMSYAVIFAAAVTWAYSTLLKRHAPVETLELVKMPAASKTEDLTGRRTR